MQYVMSKPRYWQEHEQVEVYTLVEYEYVGYGPAMEKAFVIQSLIRT